MTLTFKGSFTNEVITGGLGGLEKMTFDDMGGRGGYGVDDLIKKLTYEK